MKTAQQKSMLVCGVLFLLCQVAHVGAMDTYIGEVMIEGNATMDISGFVSEFISLATGTATIVDAELIGACEIVGDEVTCWCENENIWSDLVCDTVSTCCNVQKCVANVSDFTPMCVPKANVTINGIIMMSSIVNVQTKATGQTFSVTLNATFMTNKVQGILDRLKTAFLQITEINATSTGMVKIEVPPGKVCYNSQYMLNCSMVEVQETCTWLIAYPGQYPRTIGLGTEVEQQPCSNTSAVSLLNITGIWSGTYTCLLTNGTVSHSASADVIVALLPEIVNLTSQPPTIDCSVNPSASIVLTCAIYPSTETYIVTINDQPTTVAVNSTVVNYTFTTTINCLTEAAVSIPALCKIGNSLNQVKAANISIPIIHPGDLFCDVNGTWPKTKAGEKAVVPCDITGRIGTMERVCNGSTWLEPDILCTKAMLNVLLSSSSDFEKGVGATQEGACSIFESLKNNTASQNTYGDVTATVNVLLSMSRASGKVVLYESLLPNFIESASNVLNITWKSGDPKRDINMATSYLTSVEDLVKNIQLNNSDGHNSSNIQLQVCRKTSVCNKTVFNVEMELNSTSSMVKTMGIQNMATRLPKGVYEHATFPSIVVTAVVENDTNPVNIRMAYPLMPNDTLEGNTEPTCIFWNVTEKRWSTDGCVLVKSSDNMSYCECDHLTSFSQLLSKTPVHLPFIDQITYIGLGVSICSLIVFILIEFLVWKTVVKSNLSFCRHISLVNIAVCLLLADCSFVASSFPNILNDTLCLVLVFAKHFFFLAMFFWMLCLSIMLVRQLIFVFSTLSKKIFIVVAIIIGYICPTIIVVATYCSYLKTTDVKYHSRATCWLTYVSPMKGSIYAFLIPIFIIVFINIISIVVVISTLLKPSETDNSKKYDKEAAKSILKVIVFLTPVFGGTWILGLFIFLMDDNMAIKILIHYSFTIFNSLQGFFILLTGCFGEKRVRDEIVRLVNPSKAKSESKTTLTSNAK
ncbi:adhesion G-protein coupled receptor F3 [Trichomycterus rosablanca]|uniref:adhesion G-protein coupled receptor F3 n=1 Tax=Trichomycterus rosablanca TaxID=2290929 RepID=UPI002F35838A